MIFRKKILVFIFMLFLFATYFNPISNATTTTTSIVDKIYLYEVLANNSVYKFTLFEDVTVEWGCNIGTARFPAFKSPLLEKKEIS